MARPALTVLATRLALALVVSSTLLFTVHFHREAEAQ
jgi:hypothetical protein